MSENGELPLGRGQTPLVKRLWRVLVGRPRTIDDPNVFHTISLIAFLAWVGLGADGLSSSAYGPEEAFKALGEHRFLAVAMALATAFTVFVIALSYSRIIERFPFGGGGYVVAGKLLGAPAGVVSGSALIIDYVLTITISVAAGAEAVFSFLPPTAAGLKLPLEFAAIGVLVVLNLRGVKESVKALTPIFLVFLVTHFLLIVGSLASRAGELPEVARQLHSEYQSGMQTLGAAGLFLLFMRAYSMGAGT
ncbi:MAG: APC family permease, partial [Deltaproteobacteria bacterium]|nr:APC family permease [Deltaproteobacteria bacterium]